MPAEIDPDLALELAKVTADAYASATEELIAAVSRQTRSGSYDPDGWAARKLAETKELRDQARKIVDRLTARTPGLIRTAVTRAYDAGAREHLVATHTRAVDQLIAEATTRVTSTHGQILRSTMDAYRDVVTTSSQLVVTGAFSHGQAVNKTLDDFAKRGITGFVDKSGRRWRLDRYAEMATRTSVGRAQVAGTLDRLLADGRDLVIVSNHAGTCPVCAPWEAQVLSITGIGAPHTVTDGNGHRVRVAGSVAEAHAAGLQHPNCRHNLTAFIPGLTVPPKPMKPPTDGQERRRARNRAEEAKRLRARRAAASGSKKPIRAAGRGGGGGKKPSGQAGASDGVPFARGAQVKAKQLLTRLKAIEKDTTADVTRVAAIAGGTVERLDSKFKGIDSLARKITDYSRGSLATDAAVDRVKDGLRYSIVIGDAAYRAASREAVALLIQAGNTVDWLPSGWVAIGYRGLNVTFTSRGGEHFEVQFHTPASLEAAEVTHEMYEEWRLASTPPARRRYLRAEMDRVFATVPTPPGVQVLQ